MEVQIHGIACVRGGDKSVARRVSAVGSGFSFVSLKAPFAADGKVMRLRFLGVGNTGAPKERTEREVNPKPDPKPYTRNPKPH